MRPRTKRRLIAVGMLIWFGTGVANLFFKFIPWKGGGEPGLLAIVPLIMGFLLALWMCVLAFVRNR